MPFLVEPTPAAAQQIRKESAWWRRNRPRAPTLFRDELRRAFDLLAEYPESGPLAQDVNLRGVRRLLLSATQHYVYYRITTARIEVVAVWSTSRGKPPRLRR